MTHAPSAIVTTLGKSAIIRFKNSGFMNKAQTFCLIASAARKLGGKVISAQDVVWVINEVARTSYDRDVTEAQFNAWARSEQRLTMGLIRSLGNGFWDISDY